jgi:hypothetical protein
MHTSTSPQYAIIASCDVAAAMMEPPGGTALVEESIAEALDFRRAMRKVDERVRRGLVVQGLGPGQPGRRGHRHAPTDWVLKAEADVKWHGFGKLGRAASTCSTRSRPPSSRPAWTLTASSPNTGIPAGIVTKFLAEHGVVVEKTGLYSLLHHVHHRHHQGPLEHAADRAAAVQGRLRPQPAACGGSCRSSAPSTRATNAWACRTCARHATRLYAQYDIARLTTEMYLSDLHAGDEAQRRLCRTSRAASTERVADRRAGRAHHHRAG